MSSTQIYLSIIFVRKGMLQFEMEGHCLRWHERLEDYCRIDTDRVTLWWGRQAWIDSKTMCCNTEKENSWPYQPTAQRKTRPYSIKPLYSRLGYRKTEYAVNCNVKADVLVYFSLQICFHVIPGLVNSFLCCFFFCPYKCNIRSSGWFPLTLIFSITFQASFFSRIADGT